MRKNSLLFFILIFFSLTAAAAAAGISDLQLVPLSRYNYNNIDGYGFYEKCSNFSWFGMVFNNTGDKTAEISFPDEVLITGWNGTRHKVSNLRYRDFDLSRNNFQNLDRNGTAFKKKLSIPGHKAYAVFMDINNISNYNLYWDTNVFFTIEISNGDECLSRQISGIIAQRGNACSPDQVCTAQILSGSYAQDGSGNVIIKIRNNMPDAADITAFPVVNLSWTDSSGQKQSQTVENAVAWNSQPGHLVSGAETSISGRLSLPIEIASANREVTAIFQFFHPTSLYFGYFSAEAKIQRLSGIRGTMSGSFDTDGKNGIFTAELFNDQTRAVSVPLPGTGSIKDIHGTASPVTLTWKRSSPVSIAASGSVKLEGTFRFTDTGLIHANKALILSAELKAGGASGIAAGVVNRNPDPNPVITSAGFCRDSSSGSKKVSFAYALKNPSRIDISVDLARTMAVTGHVRNLPITYTDCESGGVSCFGRIEDNQFDLQAGETAVFIGMITLEQIPSDPNYTIRTSLVYYPDGETKYLYVGETGSVCSKNPAEYVLSAPAAADDSGSAAKSGEAVLDHSFYNAVYSDCEGGTDITFTLAVSNNGTAPGEADLSNISYSLDDETVPIQYSDCVKMSPGGSDIAGCQEEMKTGKFLIMPGSTLRLDAGTSLPQQKAGTDDITIQAEISEKVPEVFRFSAIPSSDTCGPVLEVLSDEENGEINCTVSPNKDSVTLTVRLANTGTQPAKIKTGSIYLHKAVVEAYDGICDISPLSSVNAGTNMQRFSEGSVFELPPHNAAAFTLTLPVDMTDAYASTADVSWNFNIENRSVNYTGTIDFGRSAKTAAADPVIPAENRLLHFYSLAEPKMPETLPATGFPTVKPQNKPAIQPDHAIYQQLSGLRLQIPAIDMTTDLVRLPLNENNEWAVEWLSDQAGILSSSALPGHGTSVIAAHNHLDAVNPGPFLWLFELKNNDRMFVIDEEGGMLIYSVYANELFNPDDSDKIFLNAIPGSLVLLTCETEMPEGGYAYRRAVFAEPLQ